MQSEQAMVSIIMNCYNGEKYLREAIESVLAQTYQNWEIIFWDNQSTDESTNIFKSYSDPRLRYFYAQKHTLLSEARNYALEYANGEFVAFLDVDDWWLPEKLERQIALFRDPDVGVVCSNLFIENKSKGRRWTAFKKPMPQGKILDDLLKSYFVCLVTLMVRRTALASLSNAFDNRFHIIGDFDLVIRLAAKWKVGVEQKVLACFRIHGDNESIKHRDLEVMEMECWYAKYAEHPVIGLNRNFHVVTAKIKYQKAMNILLAGNRLDSIKYLKKIPWGWLKFKLIVGMLLPASIFKFLKN